MTGALKCTKEQLNSIASLGHEVVFMQNESEDLPCAYEEVEGVICNGLFLHHSIEKFSSLKYIQLTSAGYDRVPMQYVESKAIKIYNARGVYSIPMAEFAVCGILQCYKQSKFFYRNQENREWNKHRGLLELYDKTACIVGCGSVGNECAKRISAFGAKVLGVDLYPREDEFYQKIYHLDELDKVLEIADVVILTLPLTEQTKYMMNARRFSLMKRGSVFVNIARGAIVEEKALLNALDNKILGAVIDVFEEEPLQKDSLLWTKENAIITPHNSFVGDGVANRLIDLILNNLRG